MSTTANAAGAAPTPFILPPDTIPVQQAGSTQTAPSGATATGSTKLQAFEGFLKKAGHIAGVVLSEIVRYAIPIASLLSIAAPETTPVDVAFSAAVKLVQSTVLSVQQKWASEGSAANSQKLADVLQIVEAPITTMFAQAGVQVDTGYVTNLINGVVALLNAQPAISLPAKS